MLAPSSSNHLSIVSHAQDQALQTLAFWEDTSYSNCNKIQNKLDVTQATH
jgi:hypothetical protein